MSAPTGIAVGDFVDYGGITGSASTAQLNLALDLAWDSVEEHLGTFLVPTVVTEEVHPWPHNGQLHLKYTDVQSVDAVTVRHDEETCTCGVTDVTGCAILVDPVMGWIRVQDCYQVARCSSCACRGDAPPGVGKWLIVTYTAGIGLPLTERLKLALTLAMKDYLAVLTGGTQEFADLKEVASWHSMDYGENYREKKKGNPFSNPTRADMIMQLLKPWPRKRAVMAFGNPRRAGILR